MRKEDVDKVIESAKELSLEQGHVLTGLDFSSAYAALKAGFGIRRASWLGFWVRVGDDVAMHCKDGRVIMMASADCNAMFTLENVCAHDWVVLDENHMAELDKVHDAKILAPSADPEKAKRIEAERSAE